MYPDGSPGRSPYLDAFRDFVTARQEAIDARERARGSRDPETAFQEFEEARLKAVKARRRVLRLLKSGLSPDGDLDIKLLWGGYK